MDHVEAYEDVFPPTNFVYLILDLYHDISLITIFHSAEPNV